MNAHVRRGIIASLLAGTALLAGAGLAAAESSNNDDVAVVDEPDTSGLNNKWTFAPAGIPVFGVIDSVQGVPDRIVPTP